MFRTHRYAVFLNWNSKLLRMETLNFVFYCNSFSLSFEVTIAYKISLYLEIKKCSYKYKVFNKKNMIKCELPAKLKTLTSFFEVTFKNSVDNWHFNNASELVQLYLNFDAHFGCIEVLISLLQFSCLKKMAIFNKQVKQFSTIY